MASLHCPLPDVSTALSPYIHSRQETQRIRQAITGHLLSQITSDPPPSHLTLATPTTTTQVRRLPSELPSLRREYLAALRANVAAQHRHAELSAELDALRHDAAHASSPPAAAGSGSTSRIQERDALVHTHVALRRLRRLHRQLRVVEDTVSRLTDEAASNDTRGDVAGLVERELGIAPQPPVVMPDEGGQQEDGAQELIDRLKRQVLEAKNGMLSAQKRHREVTAQREGMEEPGLAAQVGALRKARDMLVDWVEAELGKIADGDSSEMAAPEAELEHGDDEETASKDDQCIEQKIKELYEAYTSAREKLVGTMNNTSASKMDFVPLTARTNAIGTSVSTSTANSRPGNESIPLAELLPQVRRLLELARHERSLLQHSSYLRRHLAKSVEQTDQMTRRLADESHLVPPGASSVPDWTVAADDAGKTLTDAVGGWIKDGNGALAGARDGMTRMGKGGLGNVKGDV